MAPTRPYLPPLSTPKSMTFPSELRDRTYTCLDPAKPVESCNKKTSSSSSTSSEDSEMAITPPSAYTEFLNTFSPIFASPASSRANFSKFMLDQPPRASPISAPPSATAFPSPRSSYKHSPSLPLPYSSSKCLKSPAKSPDRVRRLRLPPSQAQGQHHQHFYTPMAASPLSASAYPSYHLQQQQQQQHQRPSSRYSPTEWRFRQLESPASDAGAYNLRQVVTTTITFRVAPRLAAPPVGKRKRAGAPRRSP
ncbi:hypothetical protein BJY00DRAFT_28439 [Aspergillus carlsbadensis]|nr:hypothetical protein BJY00DRAFT_28439 [Aspergillus carlsbadensis]